MFFLRPRLQLSIGVTSPVLALLMTLFFHAPLYAEATTCCNTATGDWTADSNEACAAKPGHVPYAAENMQQIMVCLQKTQQQAMEAAGYSGMPAIPGMPSIPGVTPTSAEEEHAKQCCDTQAAQWAESMLAEDCLALADHYPDTPEYLGDTEICRSPQGAQDASAEGITINIANGGFERWDRDEPEGFMNFDGGNQAMEASREAGVDMQTVFKSSDAHTGNYSLELKARRIELPPRAAAYVPKESIPVSAGGVTSCGKNCASLAGGSAQNSTAAMAIEVDDPGEYLCGVYKGSFVGGDQLWVNAVAHSGEQVIGGTNSGTGALNLIDQNSAVWKEFKLPIMMLPGSEGKTFSKATLELTLKAAGGIRTLGPGMGKVHEGTAVKVDSVRFCDGSGITLYKPRVVGIGRIPVSNPDEFDIGAQTFVNLDNDDQNGEFDIDDTKMGKDDNELIEMELYMPKREYGFVELRRNAQDGAVRVWEDPRKTKEFDQFDDSVQAPGFLEESDDEWRKTLWVEGIKPSSMQRDIEFEFVFTQTEGGTEIEQDEVAITILGIESIEWEGKNNSVNDDNTLDPDPNWPASFKELKSWRVFPGRRWAGDQPEDQPRDTVDVKVTLNVKPVEPVEWVFRSIDVDDPSADDDEVDDESRRHDNRGKTPQFWGGFVETDLEYQTIEFFDDNRTFEFKTTQQPGDNFRIIGGPDVMTLMELENDDTSLHAEDPGGKMKVVDSYVMANKQSAEQAEIREAQKYASDVLTVWRKLYIEIDSMGEVKDNEVTANIVSLRLDGDYQYDDGQGNLITTDRKRQWITIDTNLFQSLPEESQAYREGYVNNFNTGTMTIKGSRFQTFGNTAHASGNDEVLVVHSSGGAFLDGDDVVNLEMKLIDDDHYKNGDVLPALQTDRIEKAFAPAYIVPDYSSAPNPHRDFPFMLHFKDDDQMYLKKVFMKGFDNRVYHDMPDFWVVYLLNAYQGKLNEDGDGEGGLSGQADGAEHTGLGGFGAAVFQESGWDTASGYSATNSGLGWQMEDVAPHEIAHLFGALHEDGGLMSYDAVKTTEFEPVTLDKIRHRANP